MMNSNLARSVLHLTWFDVEIFEDGYLEGGQFLKAGGKSYKDLTTDRKRNGGLWQRLMLRGAKATLQP